MPIRHTPPHTPALHYGDIPTITDAITTLVHTLTTKNPETHQWALQRVQQLLTQYEQRPPTLPLNQQTWDIWHLIEVLASIPGENQQGRLELAQNIAKETLHTLQNPPQN